MSLEHMIDDLPVKRLKHYQLLRLIDRGQTSALYLATDESLNRPVAIKLLNPEVAVDSIRAWQFVSQAAVAARVLHPNIVQIYFAGQAGTHCFCVREYVSGSSLDELIRQGLSFTEEKARDFAQQILQGLAAGHARGIIHGNLTGRNVLYDQSESRILLSDFQAAQELNADQPAPQQSSTGSSGFEFAAVQADLRSVGDLMQKMLGSKPDHSLVLSETSGAAVSERRAEREQPSWLIETSTIIRRLKGEGNSLPFASAEEAVNALNLVSGESIASTVSSPRVAETELFTAGSGVSTGQFSHHTAIIQLPAWDTATELPKGVFELQGAGTWNRGWQWFLRCLRVRRQESPIQVQQTFQAANLAVEEVQRRLRWLERLAAEGLHVLRQLQQVASQPTPSEAGPASAESVALEGSITEQEKQLDEIERRRSELEVIVERLVPERDALQARLNAVRPTAAKATHNRPARKRSWVAMVAQVALCIALFGFAGYLLYNQFKQTKDEQFYSPWVVPTMVHINGPLPSSKETLVDLSWIPEEMTAIPLRTLFGAPRFGISSATFHPKRNLVAGTSNDDRVRIWSADNGMEVKNRIFYPERESATRNLIAFSPDGVDVAIGCSSYGLDCLMIWDTVADRVKKVGLGDFTEVYSMSYTADGKKLAVVTKDRFNQTVTIDNKKTLLVLIDVQSGQILERVPAANPMVQIERVECAPVGTLLAVVAGAEPLQIWDTQQHKFVHSLTGHRTGIQSVEFSADASQLAAGCKDGSIVVWKFGQESQSVRLASPARDPKSIKDVAFSPDGRIVAGIGGGFAMLWDQSSQAIVRYFVTGNEQLKFSHDGHFLLTAGWDSDARTTSAISFHSKRDGATSIWDASDLTRASRESQEQVNARPGKSASQQNDLSAVIHKLRHLTVTQQMEHSEYHKSIKEVAAGLPKIDVDLSETPARWQQVKLNNSGLGWDGIRFSSSLAKPADLNICFNTPKSPREVTIQRVGKTLTWSQSSQFVSNLAFADLTAAPLNQFHFQILDNGQILPGEEFVIGFTFDTQDPVEFNFAMRLSEAAVRWKSWDSVPEPTPKKSVSDIVHALGWQLPLQGSGVPEDYERTAYAEMLPNVFEFQPRLPFSRDRLPSPQIRWYHEHAK